MTTNKKHTTIDELTLKKIIESLEGLRFGSVLLTVHNSKVVQIDRVEKTRIDHDSTVDIGGNI